MRSSTLESPAEADVRFLRYRLELISYWAPSPRKDAAAEAIAQRLASIARCALARPDSADLLPLSCRPLEDSFAVDDGTAPPQLPSTEKASSTLPGIPPLGA